MLKMLECDYFKIGGKNGTPRGPIVFHEGLNTILGGQAAENSIGKSTLLLAIDFCFGGESYTKQKFDPVIGAQAIKFVFEFSGQSYYFIRDTVPHNVVWECDSHFRRKPEPMMIDEFRAFLQKQYKVELKGMSFRDIVSRFIRIYGLENYQETKPLHLYAHDTCEAAVGIIIKLFDLYSKIEAYKTASKLANDKKKAFSASRRLQLVPYDITTNPQRQANTQKIAALTAERDLLTAQTDRNMSAEDIANAGVASGIKSEIKRLSRQRSRIESRLSVIRANQAGGEAPSQVDLDDLLQFFPGLDVQRIELVESFHHKIQHILSEEMDTEIESLESILSGIDSRIKEYEEQLRAIGTPAKIPQKFLDKLSELNKQIAMLEDQNKAYDDSRVLRQAAADAKKALEDAQEDVLKYIMDTINDQMVVYNTYIDPDNVDPPKLRIPNSTTYKFDTNLDGGAGTAFKNLIIFDLSILRHTKLPVAVHDSQLFKNIQDRTIEKIMELYLKCIADRAENGLDTQIFISFDKDGSFSQKTQQILSESKVIKLEENGGELFGYSWAKKEKPEEAE